MPAQAHRRPEPAAQETPTPAASGAVLGSTTSNAANGEWLASQASTVEGHVSAGGELARGQSGDAVKQLQVWLGMEEGEVDGLFGPATEAALRDWQSSRHIQPTGRVGATTYGALARQVATASAPALTRLSSAVDGGSIFKQGSRGEAVRELQTYLGIPADGIYGPQTARAVTDFQRNAGLSGPDGRVGPNTLGAIRRHGSAPPAANNPQVPETAAPEASSSTPTASLGKLGAAVDGGSIFKPGSRGEAVRELQKYLGIPTDGVYGPQTARAVLDFQRNAGLSSPDGRVGPNTLGAMRRQGSAPTTTHTTNDQAQQAEAVVSDLSTPQNAAPIIDQHRMNHEWNDGFCGLATVITTLEANGKGEWNIHDRNTMDQLQRQMYTRGAGSSGALMASYMRKMGEENASFTTGGSVSLIMSTLSRGEPVPVGFASISGQVMKTPQPSKRYGNLGARHSRTYGISGHWATVVGFEGPASNPSHFLVNDPDTGAQLKLTRSELERHTDARNGIWMIPY